jgi:hypothetical protein
LEEISFLLRMGTDFPQAKTWAPPPKAHERTERAVEAMHPVPSPEFDFPMAQSAPNIEASDEEAFLDGHQDAQHADIDVPGVPEPNVYIPHEELRNLRIKYFENLFKKST